MAFSQEDFIVFTVSSSMEEYDKYLKQSITTANLQSSMVMGTPTTNIAKLYNNFIRTSSQRFIIFAHQDVEFSPDIIEVFNKHYYDYLTGTVGLIGKGFDNITYFGGVRYNDPKIKNVKEFRPISCLDSCFCIIDKTHNCFFDEITFDGLHCFVEDYCCNQLFLKRNNIIIEVDKVEHWGTTTAKLGTSWGNYRIYLDRLCNKWKNKVSLRVT